MVFVADTINFREIAMKESLPLVTIQTAVIDFLRGRNDVALFGAQAVNVYVDEPRATQHVDLMSPRAPALAKELREHISDLFQLAVRIRQVKDGAGYRIFQLRESGNRHLVGIRSVDLLPHTEIIDEVRVLSPAALIASKVISHTRRRGTPKSWTDRRDLILLVLAFPDLQSNPGPVTDCLVGAGADPGELTFWQDLVGQEFTPQTEDDDF